MAPNHPKSPMHNAKQKKTLFFFFLHKNRTNNLIVQRGS